MTKKTAKKTRNSSMAVKLVAILVLMVAVTMVSNVINYDAMVKMNHSIKDVTDSKVPDLQNAYNIQYSLEAVQKDFYRYLATAKGETSHTEARNDYAADREAVASCTKYGYPCGTWLHGILFVECLCTFCNDKGTGGRRFGSSYELHDGVLF